MLFIKSAVSKQYRKAAKQRKIKMKFGYKLFNDFISVQNNRFEGGICSKTSATKLD